MSNRALPRLGLAGIIGLQLMTSGCLGLGGGAAGIFGFITGGGNGEDSDSGSTVASLIGGGGGGSAGSAFSSDSDGVSSGSAGGSAPAAATIHNPEPGSLLLFGAGLAGLSLGRRRKKRRSA